MQPHYYLMKSKKILRLEAEQKFTELSWLIQGQRFNEASRFMTQDEANWRVALFRDEIMEVEEYVEFLNSPASTEEYLEEAI